MKYFYALLFLSVSFLSAGQTFDNSFKPIITAPANISTMTAQSDGKIIVSGNFTHSGSTVISNIIRLNADGSRDVAFNTGTGMTDNSGYAISVNDILVQPDGKILAGGFFSFFNGVAKKSLVRLNADGSLDGTFNDFTSTTTATSSGNGIIYGLALQSDGKIIVRGHFDTVNGVAHKGIVRLNADGSLDNTLTTSIVSSSSGSNYKEPVIVRSDGKILVSGRFTSVNNVTYNRIVRLNADGTTDTSFNPGTGFNDDVHSMVVQSDSKILLCGKFTSFNGTTVNRFLRLNENGNLDTTFPYTISFNSGNWVDKIALQSDGKILVGGSFQSPAKRILRLTVAGAIDGTFSSGTGPEALTANGVSSIIPGTTKIYLGGDFITYNGTVRNGLVVVSTTGTIDTGIDLKLGIPATVNGAHLQSDGKLVVVGNFTYINGLAAVRIGRLNTNGSLDNTFTTGAGFDNVVQAVSAQSDGKLLVGGTFYSYNGATVSKIVRLNTDGSRDTGFTPTITTGSTSDGVYHIHRYSDDKILIGGGFTAVNGNTYKNLARLNSNGTSDLTFSNNVFTSYWLLDMDVRDSDGAIIVTSNINGVKDLALLNANGTVITSFNAKSRISQTPAAVSFTPDGKVLLGGTFTYDGGSTKKLIKLDMNANLDPLFNFEPLTSDVSRIEVVNSKYLVGYGDYGGFSSGKFDIVSEQGSVFSAAIPLYGNTRAIVKGTSAFYVAGSIVNPDETGVNGVLKFTIPASPATAPSGLQATVQPGKVILSWTYSLTGELGFSIYRAKPGDPFTAVGATAAGITTFTDLTIDPETAYNYVVKASYLAGDSPASNEVAVTTLADKPKAPSNLVLTETSPIEISLTWQDNSINETEMLVYRLAPGDATYSLLTRLPANTISYNDQLLIPGKAYSYYLKAVNAMGESAQSTIKSLTLSDPTASGSWSNKNPATGIERYSGVSFVIGNKAYVGTGGNATGRLKDFWEYDPTSDSWTKKADFPGTARVGATGFAINGKGYIGTGNDGTLVDGMVRFRRDFYQYDPVSNTWTQVADYPEDFTSEAGISAGISFVIGNYAYTGLGNNGVGDPVDFYRYDPVANQWTKMADFAGTGRSSAVSFAGNGKGYVGLGGVSTKYKDVWEYDPAANLWTKMATDFTSTARASAVAFVVNNRAYIGTGNAGDLFTEANTVDFRELNLISKTWRTIPDFTGTARSSAVSFVIGDNAYVALGTSGSTYFTDVKSYLSGSTLLPDKPTDLTAQVAENQVTLSWSDQSDNEIAFIVERSQGNTSSFTRIATLDPGIVSFIDNTVASGFTYYYRVASFNAYGPSEYSNTVNISTMPPPAIPLNFQVNSFSAGKATLSWSAVASAASYRIYRLVHDQENNVVEEYKVIEEAWPSTTYVNEGLQPLIYFYKVQAVNAAGSSDFSTEKSINLFIAPPATPANFQALYLSSDKITLQWSSAPTATSYRIYRTVHDVENNVVEEYKVLEEAWTGIVYTDAGLEPFIYTYKIQAVNLGGGSSFTAEKSVNLQVILGIPEVSSDLIVKLYPNPVVNKLMVETKSPGQLVSIVNIHGQIVQEYTLNDDVNELNTSELPAGLYILKTMNDREAVQKKFIKK